MKKEFSLNLLLLLGLNLLVKPVYIFGIDLQIQNRLGPEEYGLFFSIYNYTLLFQVFLEFGITNLIKRDISDDESVAPHYFSGLLGLKVVLSVIYILLTVVAGFLIGYDTKHFILLAGMMGIQICMTFISFARATLAGLGAYKLDSMLSVFDKILMIVILGVLLFASVHTDVTLNIFMGVYLFSVALCALTGILICLKKVHIGSLRLSKKQTSSFIKRAFPYALITFLMSMYGRIDAVFLERLLPDGNLQAGIYAAGFRLLDVYMMFALLFSNLLLPMLTRNLSNPAKARQFLYYVCGILMSCTIICGTGGYIFRNEITYLFYHNATDIWVRTTGLLILCMIPVGISLLYGAAILACGKLKKQNLLFASGVLFSVVINLLLIPVYKSTGAAMTALIVNSLVAAGQIIIFYRESNIEPSFRFYVTLSVFIPLCMTVFIVLKYLNGPWILSVMAGGFLCLIMGILLKIVPREMLALKNMIFKEK